MNTRMGRLCAVFFISILTASQAAGADQPILTFDSDDSLKGWSATGDVTTGVPPAARRGNALRLGKGAKAILPLRDDDGTGKVEFWMYEDGAAPAETHAHAAGPLWGVMQADGQLVAVGSIYAPYLAGHKSYTATSINSTTPQTAWSQVQYLGGERAVGWHKWTFDFDPDKGLSLALDNKLLGFNWNHSKLAGFRSIVLIGDTSSSGQMLWVDDMSITLGAAARVKPVSPPPPASPPPASPPPATPSPATPPTTTSTTPVPHPPADLTVLPPQTPWNPTPYAHWKNGPNKKDDYFPIGVWSQSPRFAPRYKAAGINLYVGLYGGPTKEQMDGIHATGMPVICSLNEYARKHLLDDPLVVGWSHGDEPDNSQLFKDYWNSDKKKIKDAWPDLYQSLGLDKTDYKGFGPPIPPKWIIRDYAELKRQDPTRPIYLNLGMGVSFAPWIGRGECTGKLEDYPEYLKGCDIGSYDIYPAYAPSQGKVDTRYWNALWHVPQGIRRLREWSGDTKPMWMIVGARETAGTPQQIKAEVWMSIIHGARGICYFVHQFKPTFNDHALLDSPDVLAMVTSVNMQITELASVLNSPTVVDAVKVESTNAKTPVHVLAKRKDSAIYIFSAAMYSEATKATFRVEGCVGAKTAEVLGEDRSVKVSEGVFTDAFAADGVHIYRINEGR